MLIKELIVRHLGQQGALHERGIRLTDSQVPPGVRAVLDGDDPVAPVAGDLLIVSAPVGPGLPERIDPDLPVGVTVALLFEVEVPDLPVDRVLAALAVAKLQVVEAAVVSGTATATVAVVAQRTDELVTPAPDLAHDLEPGDHKGPAVLRRMLGEHALEGLVQPARERELRVKVGALESRLVEVSAELEKFRADRQAREAALVGDRDNARRDANSARKEAESERMRMQALRSSTSFKVASRLARVLGVARRIIPRSGRGRAKG